MRTKLKTDRGVAGLSILLALVTMLFVIGLLVMIFALMGTELRDATYTSTSATVTNETVTGFAIAGDLLAKSTERNVVCTMSALLNATTNTTIPASNYTVNSGCNLTATATSEYIGYDVKATYTYVYDADNTATNVMNDTTVGIGAVTEWYPIFIVIGAMVVLILLTVIIITAIRGSGMMVGEGSA